MRPSLTLRLLYRVSWPHLSAHRLRTGLTLVGVALGVATVVAIADVGESLLASFRHTVRTIAGESELEVTAAAGTLDDALVERVAAVAGVRAAAGILETFLPLAGRSDETVCLLGIDFLGSPVWETQFPRAAIEMTDEVEFLSRPDSVLIARRLARTLGIELGGELHVVVPAGPRTLRVRGLLDDVAVTRLFGGALAVMDLPAAELLLDRPRQADRIALQVAPGQRIAVVRDAVARALGDGFAVDTPESRGAQTEQLLYCLRAMIGCNSVLAVIVGALIVYQTVTVSIEQRRRQLAILNAVGVGRRSLTALCLAETFVLGALGGAAGVIAGRWLGAVVGDVAGIAASEIWVRVDSVEHARSWWAAAVGLGVGLGVSLATAALAVRTTFRAPTVEAMRPAGILPVEAGRIAWPLVAGLLLVLATGTIVLMPRGLGLSATVAMISGYSALGFLGVAVLAPGLVAAVGLGARRGARWSTWLPVRLAAENLPRRPGRSGATVTTIAVAMGIAIGLAVVVQSFQSAWLAWIDQHFAADLLVGAGGRVRLMAGPPIAGEIVADVARIPGVASVEPFRVRRIRLGEHEVFLQGVSVPDRLAHGGLPMVEGDFAAAAAPLEAGTGVLLSDNLAFRLGLHRGDTIDVPTPAGIRRFDVEGTYVDYLGSLDLGAVAVARTQLQAVWNDDLANMLRVWLAPDASPSEVRSAILARVGGSGGYYVLDAREFLDGVRAVIGRFFVAGWAIQIVSLLIGTIGVVNAQLATVLDRATEIAALRTIGVSRRDLTRSVVLECGALGLLGGAVGVALGALLGAQMMLVSLRLMTGWRIALAWPGAVMLSALILAAGVSAMAGWVPARAAGRLDARQRSVD